MLSNFPDMLGSLKLHEARVFNLLKDSDMFLKKQRFHVGLEDPKCERGMIRIKTLDH